MNRSRILVWKRVLSKNTWSWTRILVVDFEQSKGYRILIVDFEQSKGYDFD